MEEKSRLMILTFNWLTTLEYIILKKNTKKKQINVYHVNNNKDHTQKTIKQLNRFIAFHLRKSMPRSWSPESISDADTF